MLAGNRMRLQSLIFDPVWGQTRVCKLVSRESLTAIDNKYTGCMLGKGRGWEEKGDHHQSE